MIAKPPPTDTPSARLEASSRAEAQRRRAHDLIPGGAHTYAKGDDQYPEGAPAFIVRGRGCHVWDLDGHEFIEYGMGLRSVTLGHAHPAVVEAAAAAMRLGTNFTRPSPLEADCAERLLGLVRGADMAKFCKNGSDATTAAAQARAGVDRARSRRHLPRSALLLDRRLVHRIDGDARRDPAERAGPDGRLPLQRPRKRRRPLRPVSRADRLPGPRARGRPGAGGRLPRGPSRPLPRRGRPARLRRDDHGLPLAPRRRADALRRDAGSLDLREGAGQRLRALGAGRPPRRHGARRPEARRGARVPSLDDPRRRDPRPRRRASRR